MNFAHFRTRTMASPAIGWGFSFSNNLHQCLPFPRHTKFRPVLGKLTFFVTVWEHKHTHTHTHTHMLTHTYFLLFYQVNLTGSGLSKQDWWRNRLLTWKKCKKYHFLLLNKFKNSNEVTGNSVIMKWIKMTLKKKTFFFSGLLHERDTGAGAAV